MAVEWFEADVRELERRLVSPLPRHPIVFYGSSSITLWNTLGRDLRCASAVNLGFGGSTLEACVGFFERLVLPRRPASLVVYAGDNDLGDGRTPQQVAGWFKSLVAKVDRHLPHTAFAFISIKPSPSRMGLLGRISHANDAIQAEIARHPTAFYVDVFTPMLDSNGRPRPELFVDDGLHLSAAGYRLWTHVLEQHRDRIFTADCGGSHTIPVASKRDGP